MMLCVKFLSCSCARLLLCSHTQAQWVLGEAALLGAPTYRRTTTEYVANLMEQMVTTTSDKIGMEFALKRRVKGHQTDPEALAYHPLHF